VSRAKHVLSEARVEGSARDAKVDFVKKTWNGRGLCELSVLGAINFLKLVLMNILEVRISWLMNIQDSRKGSAGSKEK
jgi:hypothetical protein